MTGRNLAVGILSVLPTAVGLYATNKFSKKGLKTSTAILGTAGAVTLAMLGSYSMVRVIVPSSLPSNYRNPPEAEGNLGLINASRSFAGVRHVPSSVRRAW